MSVRTGKMELVQAVPQYEYEFLVKSKAALALRQV